MFFRKKKPKSYEEYIDQMIPELTSIEPFTGGANRNTFKLLDKDFEFVIKFDIDPVVYAEIVPKLASLGVKTPEIMEVDNYMGLNYVMMHFVKGDLLRENLDEDTFQKLGEMLKKIHQIEGEGFGKIKKGTLKGEYNSFTEYVQKQFLKNVEYDDASLLPHLQKVEARLKGEKTVFNHMDFSTSNIMRSDGELFLIDFGNEAGMNYPYFDLAKAVINDSRFPGVLEGYKESYGFDLELLSSFVYIVALRKFVSWRKRGKEDRIEHVKKLFPEIRIA